MADQAKTSNQAITAFLTHAADLPGSEGVAALLGEITEAAGQARYPLIRRSEVTPLKETFVRNAIEGLTGHRPTNLIWVSAADPWPRPDWMTAAFYEHCYDHDFDLWCAVHSCLASDLSTVLRDRLWDGYWQQLDRRYGQPEADVVWDNLYHGMFGDWSHQLYGSLNAAHDGHMSDWSFEVFQDALQYLMVSCLLQDLTLGPCLESLVRVMTWAIPLGPKADDPDTWLVLCA